MKAVWPNVTVTDESLTRCISEVRRAIDDVRADQAYHDGNELRMATAHLAGARTFMAVLIINEGRLLGALTIYRHDVPLRLRGHRAHPEPRDCASDGQILISPRMFAAVQDLVDAAPAESLQIRGLARPLRAHNVLTLRAASPARPEAP